MTKNSTLASRQKKTVIFIAVTIVILAIAAFIVNYLVSLGEYVDVDGTKYTIKPKDGSFVLVDSNGYTLDTTTVESGGTYFVTDIGTLVAISDKGAARTYAVVDTDEGEATSSGTSLLIFPKVDPEIIKSLTINNEHGTYSFVRSSTGSITIKGYEQTVYNSENYSYLSSFCGFLVAMRKYPAEIVAKYPADEYGFDDPQASFTIETETGLAYTIEIGDAIVSGNGYYVRLVGRETVYIVNGYYSMLLSPIEEFVEPAITLGLTMSNYPMVHNFKVVSFKYDEDGTPHATVETALTLWDLSEREDTEYSTQVYKMTNPELFNYIPNTSAVTDTMLGIADPTTAKVVKLGVTDAVLKEYGLDKPQKVIQYDFIPDESTPNYVIRTLISIGPMTDERTHYVTSAVSLSEDGGNEFIRHPGFDMILEIGRSNLPFMGYGKIDWVERYYFHRNIMTVESMEFNTGDANYIVTFEADEDDIRKVTINKDGKRVNVDVKEFKIYYRNLLYGSLYDATDLTDEEHKALIANENNFRFSYRVKTKINKLDNTYAFYRLSDTKSYVTIDGGGEFFVLSSFVEKYISDIEDLYNGIPLTALSN